MFARYEHYHGINLPHGHALCGPHYVELKPSQCFSVSYEHDICLLLCVFHTTLVEVQTFMSF